MVAIIDKDSDDSSTDDDELPDGYGYHQLRRYTNFIHRHDSMWGNDIADIQESLDILDEFTVVGNFLTYTMALYIGFAEFICWQGMESMRGMVWQFADSWYDKCVAYCVFLRCSYSMFQTLLSRIKSCAVVPSASQWLGGISILN